MFIDDVRFPDHSGCMNCAVTQNGDPRGYILYQVSLETGLGHVPLRHFPDQATWHRNWARAGSTRLLIATLHPHRSMRLVIGGSRFMCGLYLMLNRSALMLRPGA